MHLPLTRAIDMDAVAEELGETDSLELFFAERHSTLSCFRIETSLECFTAEG